MHKSEFSTKITLPYFSKDTENLLQTDASKKGFGTVFILDNKPVYFTSSTLTPNEKNYLYGGHFTLQSNQKPLVMIFIKHLCNLSLRIAGSTTSTKSTRMHLQAQNLNLKCTIQRHSTICRTQHRARISSVPDNLKNYWNCRQTYGEKWYPTEKPQVHSAKDFSVSIH